MRFTMTPSFLLLTWSAAVVAFPAAQNDPKSKNRPCHEDNPLRALEHSSSAANSFCPGYLASHGRGPLPTQLGGFQRWEYYSACSCYEKTASQGVSHTSTDFLGATATGGSFPFAATGSGSSYLSASGRSRSFLGSGSGASCSSALSTVSMAISPSSTAAVGLTTGGTASRSALPAVSASAVTTVVPNATSTFSVTEPSNLATSSSAVISDSAAASTSIAGGLTGPGSPAGPIKPGSKGKRGIAYNYKSQSGWSAFFKGSPYAVWGSNWDDSRTDALDSSFTYVPTIVVDSSLSNANWLTTVPDLIQSGSTTLFDSNEPDNAGQANLKVSDCVTVYQKYMQPFAGQAALGTPAVTNGGGAAGLAYLDSFAGNCTGCSFNFINVHFYLQRNDVNTVQFSEALKQHIDVNIPTIQEKHNNLKGLPIMIGEFWLTGASDQEGENLMLDLLPYLDGNDNIMGYQAFGGLWEGNFITPDGTGLTPAAQKYNTYSAPPSMTSSL